jgi:hypothetical protein
VSSDCSATTKALALIGADKLNAAIVRIAKDLDMIPAPVIQTSIEGTAGSQNRPESSVS